MSRPVIVDQASALVRRGLDAVEAVRLRRRNPQLSQAFGVRSHLTVQERVALSELAAGKDTLCEIGSYLGASACCFGVTVKARGSGRILCIDTWNNDAMTEGSWDTFAEFKKNTAPYEPFIVPVRGLSTDVVAEVARLTPVLDLFFIDGDHSYEGAKADWDAYRGFLRPGSVVVFHDCGWAEGVQRVIREDAEPVTVNAGRLPNMWWATLKA